MSISPIEFHPQPQGQPVFSILIATWNNLPYLKCCVESIRKNSRQQHEIIVHVNEGTDGTLAWVKDQNLSHSYSKQNVGVCYGFNSAASMATSENIVLSDDDCYFAPDWDHYLIEEVKKVNHLYYCISGTLIEHEPSRYPCMIAPHDFGKKVEEFDEQRFLDSYQAIPFEDWNGSNWYPMVLNKRLWDLIGGMSIEFTPGISSDPDMMMKLWHCGVRYFKGVSQSRAYHFVSRTVGRVKKNEINNGNNQFLMKWGISKSTFFDVYLRLGKKFAGSTPEPEQTQIGITKVRDKMKRFFSAWRRNLPT